MPTERHQFIVAYLYQALRDFVSANKLGVVLFAALRVRLWPGKYREPDVVFMLAEHAERRGDAYWDGADLVMEVVSGSVKDRERDLVIKRREYAEAGIPEYWIVDPETETITVLHLEGDQYAEHGVFERGTSATSMLLPGFTVDVHEAFNAAS